MNLGIYIQSLANYGILKEAHECISKGLNNKILSDASIFYDNISFQPFNFNCGLFNSTELWNFSGKLITTSLSPCIKAIKIVNNIDVFYYYGLDGKIAPLSLIFLHKEGIKFIARSENDAQDLYRKTGINPIGTTENFEQCIEIIR